MRKTFLLLALFTTLAVAQRAGPGFGIVLGEPTGLSGKFWLGENVALDLAAGVSVHRHVGLHFHGDVLFHNFRMSSVPRGKLPTYIGLGGRFKLAGREKEQHPRIGVRMPFGLEYLLDRVPVGLFFEIAPTLNLDTGAEFDINGGIGARWYSR